MIFTAGTKLGAYEIVGPLGAGGMGEVYRARDAKLKRDVAIKVLPDDLARDPERVQRFQREAEILASLNHPHIAAIYELLELGDERCLVLELVEGPTLADLVALGPMPLDEALSIASQTALALEAAHERGIIHRDLKPGNVKIAQDRSVKVLDFGLAKVCDERSAVTDASNFPTMALSMPGRIVGTAAYMSPEQAKGQDLNRTSDVWAFGCVLYEMLTGCRVFDGRTTSDILAAVLTADPDWDKLPADTPPGLRRLLRRCLQKDRALRLRDVGDARLEIADVMSGSPDDAPAAPRGGRRLAVIAVAVAGTLVLGGALATVWSFRSAAAGPEMRLEIVAPPTADTDSLAISPDGQQIVFEAPSNGQPMLWLRALRDTSARPLPGTDHGFAPFWSPNGASIGFFADSSLKRIDLGSGSVRTLAAAEMGSGGSWNDDDTIVFASNPGVPILRISATGGEPIAVTRFEAPQQSSQAHPQFLPDGDHFLYLVGGSGGARGAYVGQLSGSEGAQPHRLLETDGPVVYEASGHLLFVRDGTLVAQRFDPARLALTGNPLPVAERVGAATAVSASAAGPITYRAGSARAGQKQQFVWLDRSGKGSDPTVFPVGGASPGAALSPDGRRVALFRYVSGNMDVWLFEVARGAWTRFTFDSGDDVFPIWSPDGRRILFGSNRKGVMDLYQKRAEGPADSEQLLLATSQIKFPADWSPDERFILYESLDPKRGSDLWAMSLDEDHETIPVVQTDFKETQGQFSPDGKWIAYQSDKSGGVEVYLQPFPGPGDESLVSTNGGVQPRWNPNGKELFYIGLDGRLMAVPIRVSARGQRVEPGLPVALFDTTLKSEVVTANKQQYMVYPNGERFLFNTVMSEPTTAPITVILNWSGRQ